MKKTPMIIMISAVTLVTVATIGYTAKNIFNSERATAQSVENTSQTQQQPETLPPTGAPVKHVTVEALSNDKTGSITALGTVKAVDQIKVFPATPGQVKNVKAKEGDLVKKGDIILELGGINGTKHQIESQLEIAQTNYSNAQKGLSATKAGNVVALKSAEIQLQSAQNQVNATGIDLGVIDRNIDATHYGVGVIESSLDATRYKNQQDFQKTQLAIDTLRQAQQDLDQKRQTTFPDLYTKLSQTSDPAERAQLEAQIEKAAGEFDKQSKELNNQLNTALIGYETLRAGAQLGENQVLSQLSQSQNQIEVLTMNRDSAATKLGYDGSSTDASKLAQEAVEAAKVKNQASLLQSQGQLDLAKINLEMAKNQLESLIVRAPSDGIVGELSTRPGDMVTNQQPVTQIINPNEFELKIGVNVDDAQKIGPDSKAEVQIGGKYVPVWIKSISPVADTNSKLVTVTLGLPRIFFRANQSLSARVSYAPSENLMGGNVFIPLDALIIGTEEKYVFVYDNGKAKKVTVTVGDINGSYAQITEGLEPNAQIIVEQAKEMTDGQAVTLE
ncbi:MAG: efflux RND transporter periplasmic adaptor subunit [Candidatus Gracilibacteria bacterium]